MSVEVQLKTYAVAVDERLAQLLPDEHKRPQELASAMRYACLSPGKRLRPALCLAACEAVGGKIEDALDFACALEMVHSFSLIHDDLPALDDDDLRRGRPTCHIQFGEAIAILAGDGLFSLAFETLSAHAHKNALRCIRLLSTATGMKGLVAGEAADILSEGAPVDLPLLEFIHSHKTGALIRASCEIGALIGTEDESKIALLHDYGAAVGLAFQIADDILDETSTKEELGKTAGADKEKEKATYPRLMGLETSRELAIQLSRTAIEKISSLDGPTDFLVELAKFSTTRRK